MLRRALPGQEDKILSPEELLAAIGERVVIHLERLTEEVWRFRTNNTGAYTYGALSELLPLLLAVEPNKPYEPRGVASPLVGDAELQDILGDLF